MSLSVTLYDIFDFGDPEIDYTELYWANITHNLNTMASKAGIYYHIWRPEELQIKKASELIDTLKDGIERLKKYPEYFQQFDAKNKWGVYEDFLQWVKEYLKACIIYPDAKIEVFR